MTVQRGDVVLVRFPFSSGVVAKIRPALVVQNDRNNQRLINTVLAMISRTTHRAAREPTQILLDPATPEGRQSGVAALSAVTCENLFTVEQQLIHRVIGHLPPALMTKIDDCLKASLGLP